MTGTDRVAVAQEGDFSSRVALQTKMMVSVMKVAVFGMDRSNPLKL